MPRRWTRMRLENSSHFKNFIWWLLSGLFFLWSPETAGCLTYCFCLFVLIVREYLFMPKFKRADCNTDTRLISVQYLWAENLNSPVRKWAFTEWWVLQKMSDEKLKPRSEFSEGHFRMMMGEGEMKLCICEPN